MKRWSLVAVALVVLAVALLAGCAAPRYYLQAVNGQFELWRLAQPVESVQADDELKRKLVLALEIRDFASRELGLPDNDSYRTYADLKRAFVVWNVFVTDEFSIRPKQWCFPVAGCVTYRGYFNKTDAEAFAAAERAAGNEVYLGGVPAYSTLGWFSDSLLSTFIGYPEHELARLLFHELAHQVAYAADDTEFNESFAVAVEEAGVERWLEARGGTHALEMYRRSREYRADFVALVAKYRALLLDLYASGEDADTLRKEKRHIQEAMKDEYLALKEGPWNGYKGYDRWFSGGLSNAKLASVGIYTGMVPGFRALLARHPEDFPRFYREVRRLAELPLQARREALTELADGGAMRTASRD